MLASFFKWNNFEGEGLTLFFNADFKIPIGVMTGKMEMAQRFNQGNKASVSGGLYSPWYRNTRHGSDYPQNYF